MTSSHVLGLRGRHLQGAIIQPAASTKDVDVHSLVSFIHLMVQWAAAGALLDMARASGPGKTTGCCVLSPHSDPPAAAPFHMTLWLSHSLTGNVDTHTQVTLGSLSLLAGE